MGRGRVRVENGTVVTDRSERIRGGAAWVYQYGDSIGVTAYSYDASYYDALRNAHLNAVRVICWFAWEIDGPKKFEANYLNGILADAKQKGYEWKLSIGGARRGGILKRWRADIAALPIGQCSQALGLRWRHIALLTALTIGAVVMDTAMLAMLVPMLQSIAQGDAPGILNGAIPIPAQYLGPPHTMMVLGCVLGMFNGLEVRVLWPT